MTEAQGTEIIALLVSLLFAVKVASLWLAWLFGLGLVAGGFAIAGRLFGNSVRKSISPPNWGAGE